MQPSRIRRRDLLALAPLALAMPSAMSQPSSSSDLVPDSVAPAASDPFIWLEDVQGERALAWVREQNALSQKLLQARPEYAPTRDRLLKILNAKDRIPQITRRGEHVYNLWQDEANKRGLWRRTTLAEYRKPQPAWETVLDLDALAAAEGENWVWGGAHAYAADPSRCLVFLSRGGADAQVVREFDTRAKAFVKDGFTLPEAKTRVDWADRDTLLIATDFGPGSMSSAGYPLVFKRWKRGTPLADAVTVFEAKPSDVGAWVSVDHTPGHERTVYSRWIDFFHQQYQIVQGGALVAIDVPLDAQISFWNHAGQRADTLLIELRSDLAVGTQRFRAGSLLAADAAAYLKGERALTPLFEPTATRSLAGSTPTREHLVLNVLDNVASRVEEWHRSLAADGAVRFEKRSVTAPFPGTLQATSLADPMLRDDALADRYLLQHTGFLTPATLSLARAGSDAREPLKALPAMFDAGGMRVDQFFATSRDGTRVPYFVVWPKGVSSALPADGSTPTLLYGYGGFEVSMQPWYSATYGSAWLERGGVLVVANIRGGGEFGPEWHKAAIRERKQRSYDDFIAVAEDLVARKITDARHLGIEGGSNGGLLMGAMLTQRPELFGAVVCQVPLLDMKRYHKLLAGASWMAEYGDPDKPEDWAFISTYSPYQNLKPNTKYPRVLFTTSTRDDRVHPGHARKMAARMLALGCDVLYYENIEGGHGGAADNEQRAHMQALEMSYLWQQLGH
jgi:prolyl oligopeptidase